MFFGRIAATTAVRNYPPPTTRDHKSPSGYEDDSIDGFWQEGCDPAGGYR